MEIYNGLKINYIEVLSTKEISINNKKYYKCKCECGNEKNILISTIKSGRIRDCGCGEYARTRLIGKRFGKLVVIDAKRDINAKKKNIICVCRCDCGNTKNIIASKLKETNSCGCLKKFNYEKYRNKKFGKITILDLIDSDKKIVSCKCDCGNTFKALLYDIIGKKQIVISCGSCGRKTNPTLYNDNARLSNIYSGMLMRCYHKNNKDYKYYGGKGIKVCDEWKNSKQNFINWALNNNYKFNLTIDRIDNNGNYEPSNCRWVDMKTQQNNRTNNKKFYYNGEYLTLSEIANKGKINVSTLRSRIRKGIPLIMAVETPLKRKRRG